MSEKQLLMLDPDNMSDQDIRELQQLCVEWKTRVGDLERALTDKNWADIYHLLCRDNLDELLDLLDLLESAGRFLGNRDLTTRALCAMATLHELQKRLYGPAEQKENA